MDIEFWNQTLHFKDTLVQSHQRKPKAVINRQTPQYSAVKKTVFVLHLRNVRDQMPAI